MSITPRPRAALAAVLGAVVAAAAVLAGLTLATSPAGASAGADGGYAVTRPVCAAPAAPDQVRCLSWRRVPVAKGTRGAHRWVRSAGVAYGPKGGYSPAALARAYAYNPDIPRGNQTVAVIDWGDNPSVAHDLAVFDRTYHLRPETAASFRKVTQLGRTTGLPRPDRDSATEISLDVQAVRGVCHTCRILLVEAAHATLGDLATAVNTAVRLGATEISNSYGMPEPSSLPSLVVRSYDHPGVVITASTGDDGWYGWDWLNDGEATDGAASFPSTSPAVVAVGGTSLVVGADGARSQEYVWNSNGASDVNGRAQGAPLGASGGGCSRLFAAPAWQSASAGDAAAGCRGKRLGTDVAAIADPMHGFDVYDSYGSDGWTTVGGTSLSAPVMAALYALDGGADSSSYPAASLYTNRTYRPTAFHDVTQGGTGYCAGADATTCSAAVLVASHATHSNPNNLGHGAADCSFARRGDAPGASSLSPECNAVPGFDGASGVGAPISARGEFVTTAKLTLVHPATTRVRHATALQIKTAPRVPGTRITGITWFFGDGSTVSGPGFVRHAWAKRGTYNVLVRLTDSRHQQLTTHVSVSVR